MIDFVKLEIRGLDALSFGGSLELDYTTLVNQKTGELKGYSVAYYQGLKFTRFEPTEYNPYGRYTIEGSLHVFWNNGEHNHNDFSLSAILEVLATLKELFGLDASLAILKQVELGVNVCPKVASSFILMRLIWHRSKVFLDKYVKGEGHYLQASKQRKYIKAYDKTKHMRNRGIYLLNEVFRFEVKYSRMKELNDLGVYTLEDLVNSGLFIHKPLHEVWNECLFIDPCLDNHKNFDKYFNRSYWEGLEDSKRKYHVREVNKVIKESEGTLKAEVSDLIRSKWNELLQS
jgi:hypothetical protein